MQNLLWTKKIGYSFKFLKGFKRNISILKHAYKWKVHSRGAS